ncbi:MAG: Rieske 2Fe-2S domain-containing protein [Varibaculum sp.]|nr:Rieske 2Fe-2S domain-containing protein [Varibaculum sp.]
MKQQVGTLADLQSGPFAATVTDSGGEELTLAVFRSDTDDQIYALDDACPHMGVPLSEGDVEDGCVECWAHGAKIELATGAAGDPAEEDAKTYPVSIEGENIFVEVE